MTNLIDVMNNTWEYWYIQGKTLFHHAISQYVTQKVSFKISQRIRSKLYNLLGNPYNQDTFNSLSNTSLYRCGLCNEQIIGLRNISDIIKEEDSLDVNLLRLKGINGVGDWTIKSIRLMMTDDTSIFLYEDKYIRSRLAELYNRQSLTGNQAKNIGISWGQNQSNLSKFFWRIKTSGIEKIKNNIALTKEDFL